jgi:dTDP-4-dehydrorhamnose reductase
MDKILIIGQTSFVASKTIEGLSLMRKKVIVPSLDELDITNINSVENFANKNDFDTVVNFAAFTNVKEATLDPNGLPWKLNVEAAGNVARVCKKKNKFLIHISTDSVFPVPDNFKGPHTETEEIKDDPDLFSAYGYTKLKGEMEVTKSGAKAAILRIAYPFGNAGFPEKDYITKLIKSIRSGYALFADQYLTPTYIRSLPEVMKVLSEKQLPGIFHWVCKGLTTPYEVGTYVNERLKLGLEVKKGSLAEYEKLKGKQPYAKFGGLSTEITESKLGLTAPTWKEAVNNFIDNTPQGLV